MKKLNEKVWKPIPMKQLFTKFVRGKVSSVSDEPRCENGVPYVGATDRNNGVIDYLEADKAKIQPGNCIVYIRDGQGSVGSSVYRATPYIATVNTSSGYAKWLNRDTGLFVSTSSNQVRGKYSFGYKRNETRLLAERVMLPVNDDGKPDYTYMAQYVSEMRKDMLTRYRNYVAERLSRLEYKDIPALSEKKWKDVELGRIADISSGRDIYAQERIVGDTPYITAGTVNNGIGYFVGNDNDSKARNAISVNRNGAVGEAFYHPYEALYGNDCRRVNLHDADDEATQLFVVQCISKQKKAFSYSRKLGTARLKRLHVMLPVDDNGEPDYAYMAQYAKNMMLRKYKQYLEFLDSKAAC